MKLLDTKIESNGFIFYGKFSEGLFQEWLKITTILASKCDLQNELLFQVGFSIYKLIENSSLDLSPLIMKLTLLKILQRI